MALRIKILSILVLKVVVDDDARRVAIAAAVGSAKQHQQLKGCWHQKKGLHLASLMQKMKPVIS